MLSLEGDDEISLLGASSTLHLVALLGEVPFSFPAPTFCPELLARHRRFDDGALSSITSVDDSETTATHEEFSEEGRFFAVMENPNEVRSMVCGLVVEPFFLSVLPGGEKRRVEGGLWMGNIMFRLLLGQA